MAEFKENIVRILWDIEGWEASISLGQSIRTSTLYTFIEKV